MEAEAPVAQSRLMWMISALGPVALWLPLIGLIAFGLSLLVVVRGRGALAGAALMFIVPMPLAVGIYAALRGAIASFSVIAMSDVQLKASEISGGISECLMAPLVGMILTVPAFLVALIGLVVRSLRDDSPRPPALPPR